MSSFQFTRFISRVPRHRYTLLSRPGHYRRRSRCRTKRRSEGVKRNHYPYPLALLLIYRRRLSEIIGADRLGAIRCSVRIHRSICAACGLRVHSASGALFSDASDLSHLPVSGQSDPILEACSRASPSLSHSSVSASFAREIDDGILKRASLNARARARVQSQPNERIKTIVINRAINSARITHYAAGTLCLHVYIMHSMAFMGSERQPLLCRYYDYRRSRRKRIV